MNSNYIDLPTRIKKDFSEINSNIVMDLYKTNKQYAELQNDVSKLKKQYPFIDRIRYKKDTIICYNKIRGERSE